MQDRNRAVSYSDCVSAIAGLNPEEQLRLLEVISSKLRRTLGRKDATQSIMKLEGLGAEIWEGIDAQEYVQDERKAWD